MRRELLTGTAWGSAALLAVWSGQAVAQGTGFDWRGSYAGSALGGILQGGAGSLSFPEGSAGTSTVTFSNNTPIFSDASTPVSPYVPWPTQTDLGHNALLGSIGGGYNFQSGRMVFGIEGDASFGGGASRWSSSFDDVANGRTQSISVSGGLDTMFSVRPRLGIAIDRLLLFGTGGLALGHASLTTVAHVDEGKGVADWAGSNAGWRLGFMLGGGAEYAVSDHVSVKLEGLYYNLGSIGTTATGSGRWFGTPLAVTPYGATLDLSGAIVRAGMNIHF